VSLAIPLDAAVVVTTAQLSTRLGDEVVILGLRNSEYYGLSDVGVRIWELLQTPQTLSAVVDAVVAEYDVERDRAVADLITLLQDLQARGLVAITPPDPS
jgi:hypothetical protein